MTLPPGLALSAEEISDTIVHFINDLCLGHLCTVSVFCVQVVLGALWGIHTDPVHFLIHKVKQKQFTTEKYFCNLDIVSKSPVIKKPLLEF